MAEQITWRALLQRLRWDLMDRFERQYYLYWFIWQVPGAFGDMLRARFLGSRMKSAGSNLRVMAGTRFRSLENLVVGDNVSIGYDNFLQARGGLTLGNDVMTAPGVRIWSINHEFGDPDIPVEHQSQSPKAVVIGNNVFIASNVFIMPGAILSDGCIVTAGSVVGGKAYRPFSILSGNPARVIGYRGNRAPTKEDVPEDLALPRNAT